MSAINRLSTVSTLQASDLLAVFSQTLGNDAAATLSTLLNWLQGQLTSAGSFLTQYASPNASGFSVTVAPPTTGANVFLLLAPGAAYAAGTLVLPSGTDGQELVVHSRQAVTALTITAAAGESTAGAPTTIAASGFFRLRFDEINNTWFRIG